MDIDVLTRNGTKSSRIAMGVVSQEIIEIRY